MKTTLHNLLLDLRRVHDSRLRDVPDAHAMSHRVRGDDCQPECPCFACESPVTLAEPAPEVVL